MDITPPPSPIPPLPEPIPTLPPAPPAPAAPSSAWVRILKILGILLAVYVIGGIILVSINPMFAWIVLLPVFYVQDLMSWHSGNVIESKAQELPHSGIVLADGAVLTGLDCPGGFGSGSFGNQKHPTLAPYHDNNFGHGILAGFVEVCDTPNGRFVSRDVRDSAGASRIELYVDREGELSQVFTFAAEAVYAADDSGNVFALVVNDKNAEGGVDRDAFLVDVAAGTVSAVTKQGGVTVCGGAWKDGCATWAPTGGFRPATDSKPSVAAEPPQAPAASAAPAPAAPAYTPPAANQQDVGSRTMAILEKMQVVASDYQASRSDRTLDGLCHTERFTTEVANPLSMLGAGSSCMHGARSFAVDAAFPSGEHYCIDWTYEVAPSRGILSASQPFSCDFVR